MNGKPLLWSRVTALIVISGLLLLADVGCQRAGRLDDKERNDRIVVKAYEMVDQGDYAAAAALFNAAIETYPAMARPHLDLALLLHDRQKDYMRAIYHYHRYLEQRPNTEKDKMILDRIHQAEMAFVSQRLTTGGVDAKSALDLLEENRLLQVRMEDAQRSVAALKAEVSLLRDAERQRLIADVIGGDSNTVSMTESVVAPLVADAMLSAAPEVRPPLLPPANVAPTAPVLLLEPPPPDETKRLGVLPFEAGRSYTVQRGDSLSKIAYKVYGDATKWRAIQDANREILGNSSNLLVGQILSIP